MTCGRIAYLAVHRPIGFVKRVMQHGIIDSLLASKGERSMRAASEMLQPCRQRADSGSEVAYLTGGKYWHQTLFCAWSLLNVSECDLCITIYDDGSLDDKTEALFRRILSGVRVSRREEIESRLDRALPARSFPTLRLRRLVYPHLRKLTDIHAGHSGSITVLDSDMLFFQRPKELLDWMANPAGACCLSDIISSYGYTDDQLRKLICRPLMDRVNVGVAGLISEEIDWHRLEFWCKSLLNNYGQSYLLEQALTALLFSERPTRVLRASDYIVCPTKAHVMSKQGVLHHYVAESKYIYRRNAWRHAALPQGVRR